MYGQYIQILWRLSYFYNQDILQYFGEKFGHHHHGTRTFRIPIQEFSLIILYRLVFLTALNLRARFMQTLQIWSDDWNDECCSSYIMFEWVCREAKRTYTTTTRDGMWAELHDMTLLKWSHLWHHSVIPWMCCLSESHWNLSSSFSFSSCSCICCEVSLILSPWLRIDHQKEFDLFSFSTAMNRQWNVPSKSRTGCAVVYFLWPHITRR